MKKLLLIALAILLILTLTACNTPTTPNTPSDNNTPVSTPEQNGPTTPSDNSDTTGRTIVISKTEGNDVKMTRGESREYDAASGTRMSDGYTAQTGSASHISLLFDNESVVKTDELTNVEVEQISEKKLSLVLLSGAIVADIASLQADESIDFKAGNVTLGIRGTSFIMEYRNENEVIIIMLEGSGYINGDTLLEAGQIAIISLHDISIEPLVNDGSLSNFAIYEIEHRDDGSIYNNGLDNLVNGHPRTDLPDGFHHYEYEYGVYAYEGYWKSGLPNGHGIITWQAKPIVDGVEMPPETFMYEGEFVDGLMHGTVTYSGDLGRGCSCFPDGKFVVYIEVNMGYQTGDSIITEGFRCHHTWWLGQVIGVPPWGMHPIDN